MRRHSYPVSWVLGVGLVTLYLGERVLAVGGLRGAFSGAGVAALVGATVLRGILWTGVPANQAAKRSIEGWLFGLSLGVLASVGLYFVQSDALAVLGFGMLADHSPQWAAALGGFWPVVLLSSVLPLLLVELSYAAMARAPKVESGRVREALFSGLGMAFVVVFAFSAYSVASDRSTKWDFSYFRTARAGEATQNLARALTEPVKVTMFFPPSSEVREEVQEYFTDLTRVSDRLELESLDQAVDVLRAKELGVGTNGTVVLARGSRKEQLVVGTELEKARNTLRNLDKDVHKRLVAVAREKRTVYLVQGHGERTVEKSGPGAEARWPVRLLKEQLQALNYEMKPLSAAEGLASEVPKDAAAVLVLGPTREPLPEEVSALETYVRQGGRVFVALDPEAGVKLTPLLAALGLRFDPVQLANSQAFVRRSHQPSDRINILTATYSSHPSVTSLGRLGSRAPMLLVGAGALGRVTPAPAEVRLDTTVSAHVATWNDLDGDFELDAPTEVQKPWELAAAVTLKRTGQSETEGRAVVVGDSDALTDAVLENAGNYYFLIDGMKWLLGDEELAGEVTSEVDVPISRSGKQDTAWFYGSTFLAPALVMAVGVLFNRRRGRRKGARR